MTATPRTDTIWLLRRNDGAIVTATELHTLARDLEREIAALQKLMLAGDEGLADCEGVGVDHYLDADKAAAWRAAIEAARKAAA